MVNNWYWDALEDASKQPFPAVTEELKNDAPEELKFADEPEEVEEEDLD